MSEERYRMLFDQAVDCLLILDLDGVIIDINRTGWERLGYTRDEMIGRHITEFNPPEFAAKVPKRLDDVEKGNAVFESVHLRKDGTSMPVEINSKIIILGDAKAIYAIVRDISGRNSAEQRIAQLAHFDGLTKLPNRTLFYDRLDQAVARAKRYQQKFAVLFMDLDGFKQVNDEFGHLVGDGLLGMAAERLVENARDMDTVARVGGDEFIFILNNIDHPDNAILVANKILESLSRPFVVNGHACLIGCSIGVSIFPDDTTDTETLVKMADDGMYMAKRSGKNSYQFFNAPPGEEPFMHQEALPIKFSG
ncbi:MAG: GGDEF domain-containing protein [Nitrosomonadales bacterium]|nr:GGDEF domain-containing protein [Nitrosomonadales bacterium]